MVRSHEVVQLAVRIRRLWDSVQLVTRTADDLGLVKQRDKLFDLELELMALHSELLKLAADPHATTLREELLDDQEQFPF